MTSEEKGIVITFGIIILAMVGWFIFTANLDVKRCEVYYGDCSELK